MEHDWTVIEIKMVVTPVTNVENSRTNEIALPNECGHAGRVTLPVGAIRCGRCAVGRHWNAEQKDEKFRHYCLLPNP